MSFLKEIWKYVVASVILGSLAFAMGMLSEVSDKPQWVSNFISGWGQISFLILIFSGSAIIVIGGAVAGFKRFPKFKKDIREYALYRIIGSAVPWVLGYLVAELLKGEIVYEKELVQGIFTGSSVVLALSGVLLGIARFSPKEKTPEEILTSIFKLHLILSVIAGLVTIFVLLFWYAKGDSKFLFWATFTFSVQLGYVLTFIFFPSIILGRCSL